MIWLHPDGTPFVEERDPLFVDPEESRRSYEYKCQKGLLTPGSCVVRDCVDPLDDPDPIRSVDTSEWLFARELMLEVPFREEYDDADREHGIVEDDKLIMDLLEKGEPIGCNNQPTLVYYLGGYTNDFRQWSLKDN